MRNASLHRAILLVPLFAGSAFALPIPRPHSSTATTRPTTAPSANSQAPAEPVEKPEPLSPPFRTEPLVVNGFSGQSRTYPGTVNPSADYVPIPDRWRIGVPGDYVQNTRGSLFNPYNQNLLKGDYPIIGDDKFLIVTATSDTLFEAHKIPVPSGVSTQNPGSFTFFGSGDQQLVQQNFILSVEFFEGDTVFKPRDWTIKTTLVENYNYIHTDERNLVSPDPGQGIDRHDDHLGYQEMFVEKHLADVSESYDVIDVRAGIQGFTSDFRGFLYSDNEPGVRFFGNYDNNKLIWNVAWFHQLEKDTDSGLNTLTARDQDVFIANLYREDFIWPGYTAQLSAAYNDDRGGTQYDTNGFLVRPEPIGTIETKEDHVYYLGWAGDGHIGRINLTHQFYQALGEESFNAIAGRHTDVNAQFFATEVSYDADWIRYRAAFAYLSGDNNPNDGHATGFDGIFDNPNFAGGGFSYFVRQAVPLTGTGVGLVGRDSFYPDLRTSKEQGQANFVNPGLLLYNVGADFDLTPKWRLITNATYLQFENTHVLQQVLFDDKIGRDIGLDLSVGMQYRPLNSQNIILTFGAGALVPGNGWRDIYTGQTVYSLFTSATFTY